MELRILELFSGIGGMHYAFKYSKLHGTVVTAMDINTVANSVYRHNHTTTPVLSSNIVALTADTVNKLDINTILMSPPCQPHTRVGNHKDIADNRSDALSHLCILVPQCPKVQYVLMENVKGFEGSQARQCFVEALKTAGYYFREFILSPTQFGVPNTRNRYYCIARKRADFCFSDEQIWTHMHVQPKAIAHISELRQMLESESSISTETYLPDKVLSKRVWLMDIVSSDASNTMCFTKAYTHYSEGTGSIFTALNAKDVRSIFESIKKFEENVDSKEVQNERLELLKSLRLRYFTPREVSRLMSFPEDFNFPNETTNRQKYRLLGNSINVCVVGELIKLLCV